jgi:lipid II:glycine glycyltransferase (peptidoglycan interpeptide bridge formation enzyme)
MNRDILSAFLHTHEWQQHSKAHTDAAGNLFVPVKIPGGSYWVSSRCTIPENWALPAFTLKSWFVRLQADSKESYENIVRATAAYKHQKVHAIQPKQTLVIDLTQSEEALLAAMKPKHRYNIRVAEKNGVTTEFFQDHLEDHFPRFWNLLSTTAERHTFRTHQENYYRSLIQRLEPAGKVWLAFAKHQEKDVAAFLLIKEGDVGTYLHGGSSYADRNVMAPYLLHWHTIRTLKAAGCTTYDLWGVDVQENGEPNIGAAAGTTRFKLGFGGSLVFYPPTLDIILNPICYSGYIAIQRLRSRKRAFS